MADALELPDPSELPPAPPQRQRRNRLSAALANAA